MQDDDATNTKTSNHNNAGIQLVQRLIKQQANPPGRRHSSSCWSVNSNEWQQQQQQQVSDKAADKLQRKQLKALRKRLDQEEKDLFEFSKYRQTQTRRYSIDLERVNKHKEKLRLPSNKSNENDHNESNIIKIDRPLIENDDKSFKMDLSFAGAGFMGCYYFGVVDCWNKYIPRERVNRVAGASAGSLIAAYYLMDLKLEEACDMIIDLLEDVRRRPLGVFDRSNQIVNELPKRLANLLPKDAHKRVNGRLFVSMTRLRDMKNVIVNEFESQQDLIDALNCSCFIPVWSGNRVSTFRGVRYIDGGFSNNLPVFDDHTIRISCFSGASDIAPSDSARQQDIIQGNLGGMPFNLNMANLRRAGRALWPPPPAFVISLLEKGFNDAKTFILDNDIIQCDECFANMESSEQPVFSKLSPTISPGQSPAVSRQASFRDLAKLGSDHGQLNSNSKYNKLTGFSFTSATNSKPTDDTITSNANQTDHEYKSSSSPPPPPNIVQSADQTKSDLHDSATSESNNNNDHDDSTGCTNSPDAPRIIVSEDEDEKCLSPAVTVDSGLDEDDSTTMKRDDDDDDNDDNGDNRDQDQRQLQHQRVRALRRIAIIGAEQPEEPSNKLNKLALRRGSQASCVSSPSERFIAGGAAATKRRNTQAQIDVSKLTLDLSAALTGNGKFTSLGEALPSCPPSPALNRHCQMCIQMRQDARADAVDEEIVQVAEKYRAKTTAKDDIGSTSTLQAPSQRAKVKSRLTSPLRWVRQQLGAKESYSFEPTPNEHQRHQAIIQTVAY